MLPIDYSRIFQFDNFTRTRKRIFRNVGTQGVLPGTFVTVHIKDVPSAMWEKHSTEVERYSKKGYVKPFYVVSLLEHEHKMSVLHMTMTRTAEYTEPIQSKVRFSSIPERLVLDFLTV